MTKAEFYEEYKKRRKARLKKKDMDMQIYLSDARKRMQKARTSIYHRMRGNV